MQRNRTEEEIALEQFKIQLNALDFILKKNEGVWRKRDVVRGGKKIIPRGILEMQKVVADYQQQVQKPDFKFDIHNSPADNLLNKLLDVVNDRSKKHISQDKSKSAIFYREVKQSPIPNLQSFIERFGVVDSLFSAPDASARGTTFFIKQTPEPSTNVHTTANVTYDLIGQSGTDEGVMIKKVGYSAESTFYVVMPMAHRDDKERSSTTPTWDDIQTSLKDPSQVHEVYSKIAASLTATGELSATREVNKVPNLITNDAFNTGGFLVVKVTLPNNTATLSNGKLAINSGQAIDANQIDSLINPLDLDLQHDQSNNQQWAFATYNIPDKLAAHYDNPNAITNVNQNEAFENLNQFLSSTTHWQTGSGLFKRTPAGIIAMQNAVHKHAFKNTSNEVLLEKLRSIAKEHYQAKDNSSANKFYAAVSGMSSLDAINKWIDKNITQQEQTAAAAATPPRMRRN